jgi:hypothetical protein
MRKHFVEFFSPGTFVPEQTRKPIDAWNPVVAVELANGITERYGAKPYGFKFVTVLTADPVPDGEGGQLTVEPKEVARSGTHFLGGRLLTFDEIPDAEEFKTLRFNMGCNDMPIVIENSNSWKFTGAFHEKDCIVDADGSIKRRGDDPDLLDYRKEFALRKAAKEITYC